MFLQSSSHPRTVRGMGGLVLGLAVLGMGFSYAQDRGRGGAPSTQERAGSRDALTAERTASGGSFTSSSSRPTITSTPSGGSVVISPSVAGVSGRPVAGRGYSGNDLLQWGIVLNRCTEMPNSRFWSQRGYDIMAWIKLMARRGPIAVFPGGDTEEFKGATERPAGWTAYEFQVPPGENIHVRLHHTNEGWFHLRMVNKWGTEEPGMLQNHIPTGNPEVKYRNPTDKPRCVYVIVDDPGWWSTKENPFSMKVARSWDPATVKVDHSPAVRGVWALRKDKTGPSSTALEAKGESSKAEPQSKS